MTRRPLPLLVACALAVAAGRVDAGAFLFSDNTSVPVNTITHPNHYTGTGGVITNTVCLNTSVLPAGVTATQAENTLLKAIATWNAQRFQTHNLNVAGNNDVGAANVDWESALLHEMGHCIGLAHPNLSTESGLNDPQRNATKARSGTNAAFDTNPGADGNYGSKDDLRGDDVNLYWFFPSTNDPLAYPAIIDTTTFTLDTANLPGGHTWVANADRSVLNALGYANTESVMQQGQSFFEAQRRQTAEDIATLKLAMAGRDGIAGNADDYTLVLNYIGQTASCDLSVAFSAAVSFAQCSSGGSLTGTHAMVTSAAASFSNTASWYFSQAWNTSTTITADSPDPSPVNGTYAVNVSVARLSSAMTGAPIGSVLVSDGAASCTATLSGSTSPATGSCSLASTTTGAKTLTAIYLGYEGFDSSTGTATHTVNALAPTVSVSDTPDPSNVGTPYTVSFTVSGSAGTPTGTVSVSDTVGSCGPVTLVGGAGSCSFPSSIAGLRTLTASYSGDGLYAAASGTTPHTVALYTPTVTLSDTPDPSASGQNFSVGASVTGLGGTAMGTVTVNVSDGGTCTITLSGGTGSCTRSSTTIGALTITGSYSGDSTYSSGSGSTAHTVKNTSITTITADMPDPSALGQGYNVAYTVADVSTPATVPTGSVSVSDGTDSCSGTLSGGSGNCTLTSTTLGAKTLVATYAGDTNVLGSASAGTAHTVGKATPAVTVSDPVDPSALAAAYAVNVSVSPSGGPVATGSVTVSDGSATCNISTLSAGAGSCNLTSTTAGAKTLTATYNGDANYTTASGTTAHAVSKGTPTLAVTDPVDPSAVGAAYAVNVGVSFGGGPAATGSVSVSDGSATCNISTLSSGSGSCNVTSTTAGAKTLTATYAGDANYTGTTGTTTHTVSKATPTVSITSDTPDPSVVGAAYAVTASVAGAGATPSGTVTVSDGSASCSYTLASGSGTCNLATTTVGTPTLTATYAGDANYTTASGTAAHTVVKATPTVAIVGDTPDPSALAQSYAVSVTVAGLVNTTGGTVNVSDGSDSCAIALASSAGSCNLASTTAGSKTLTATFVADASNNSASGTASHTVQKGTPTVTVTSDTPDPSAAGAIYTVSASVAGAGVTPAGTVTVSDAATSCSYTLSAGSGSCSLTGGAAGGVTLTASYSGDANYTTGSATAAHTVATAGTTTTIDADTPDPSAVGSAYSVAVTVASSYTPVTGSVSVGDGASTCTVTLAGTPAAGSCNLTSTGAGAKTLTATYAGDANHSGSSGTAAHTVTQATPSVTITSDAPDPSALGAAYSVAVSVGGAGVTPTGSVAVGDGTASCNITLAAGAGSCNLSSTTAGTKTLTATYLGDANYVGASGSTSHTVDKGTPTFSIVSDLPDPSVVGASYTVATSIAGNPATPGGGVTISDGSASCTTTIASGGASCSIASLTAGDKTLTATYAGDVNFVAATATAAHSVTQATPGVNIAAHTPNPSPQGGAVTVAASLTGVPTGVTASGTITVQSTLSATSCVIALPATGCAITLTVMGSDTLTATYGGDANLTTASATTAHTVTLPDRIFADDFE